VTAGNSGKAPPGQADKGGPPGQVEKINEITGEFVPPGQALKD
jgi:hypothetical protein